MKTVVYKLKCITDMHVGNGDVNYNIIDNEIQKDPILCVPTINASGVKGALRDHMEEMNVGKDVIQYIFGGEIKTKNSNNNKDMLKGQFNFLDAIFLARPMRVSKGDRAYVLVTTKEVINNALEKLIELDVDISPNLDLKKIKTSLNGKDNICFDDVGEIEVEGICMMRSGNDELKNSLKELISQEPIVIMNESDFRDIGYPIVARNCLEEGKENLWFEELVPQKSVFLIPVMYSDDRKLKVGNKDIEGKNAYNKFQSNIHDKIVQFGANASIGRGYTKVTKL